MSFDYLAEALPYPLDTIARGWGQKKSQAEVLKVVPFMEEMNRETLKVTGLKGNYKLLIDDEEIGTWSGDELAKGINLAAESKTPQYQQALTVMHLNEYRWEVKEHSENMRGVNSAFSSKRDCCMLTTEKRSR